MRCNRRGRFKKNRWRRAFSTTSKPGVETAASGTRARRARAGRKCALSSRWRNITVIIAVPRKFGRVGPFLVGERGASGEGCWHGTVFYQAILPSCDVISRRSLVTVTVRQSIKITRLRGFPIVGLKRSDSSRSARANCQLSCPLIHWNCVLRSDFFHVLIFFAQLSPRRSCNCSVKVNIGGSHTANIGRSLPIFAGRPVLSSRESASLSRRYRLKHFERRIATKTRLLLPC